jgi:pimeloyl-ACP methyl ester carboxylesterase
MIDVGQGNPILLIPGIQGRWEWMRPAIDELAASARVLSFSLSEVPSDEKCFERWESYIDDLLEGTAIDKVTLVGVSFGGLVALRYASRRPSRVAGIVLVSSPGPDFQLTPRLTSYLRNPALSLPAFALRAVAHLLPEVIASQSTWKDRARFLASHLTRTLRYPVNPRKMAIWTKAWKNGGCSEIPGFRAGSERDGVLPPTLILTGEPVLDRVVPVASTLEYLNAIPGARHVLLRRTGHIGIVSMPKVFARIVGEFLRELDLQGASGNDRGAA